MNSRLTKTWRVANAAIICIFFLSGIFSFISIGIERLKYMALSQPTVDLQEWEDIPVKNFIGTCYAESFSEIVSVVDGSYIEDGATGKFYQKNQVIALKETDLNTVAHEVSHLVDYLLFKKGIQDGEVRGYLQGYFTECVKGYADKIKRDRLQRESNLQTNDTPRG